MVLVTPEDFEAVAREVLVRPNGRKEIFCARLERKKWSCHVCTSPIVAADIWNRVDPVVNVNRYSKPKHLLYAFLLLKKYKSGDDGNAHVVNCHKNTFAKWAWIFIEQIHNLHGEVVSLG